MKMTLEEISYLSQTIASVAVVVSLVAIWFQMRQNHLQELSNSQRDVLNQSRDWWLLGVESEAMFETICAGLQDFNSLDRFQQARFHAWGANLQQLITSVYFQHQVKLVKTSSFEGYMRAFLAIINTPGGRMWWEQSAVRMGNQELSAYLTKRLNAEASTLPLWTDLLPHFRPPLLQQTAAAEKATV
jgi:hypothetical protein